MSDYEKLFDLYFLKAVECIPPEQKYLGDRADWALTFALTLLEKREKFLKKDCEETDDVCRERITRTRERL